MKKPEPNGDRVARGLGRSVGPHTSHTLTLAWLEFLELARELKGQGVFAAEFPCIAGRGGPTSGQQQLGAHEVPNLGDWSQGKHEVSIAMFPPKFQWLLKTHLPREAFPTVMSVEDTPPPDSVSALGPIDVFLLVLMFTVGDYLTVFFFMSPSVAPLPLADGRFPGPCPRLLCPTLYGHAIGTWHITSMSQSKGAGVEVVQSSSGSETCRVPSCAIVSTHLQGVPG